MKFIEDEMKIALETTGKDNKLFRLSLPAVQAFAPSTVFA